MADIEYPVATWDNPKALLNYSGGFWLNTYAGQAELLAYTAGVSLLCEQHETRVQETLESMSRHLIKNTKRYELLPLQLRESVLSSTELRQLRFGDGATFETPTENTFGGQYGPLTYKFPVPADWRDLCNLQVGTVNPSWCAVKNVQFILEDGYVVFATNPFEDPRLPQETVQDGDGEIDTVITLFATGVEVQDDTAYTHFGAPLGLPNSQHPNYTAFLNAYADSVYCGPAHDQVCRMLTAVCDIPFVQDDEETVEAILPDGDATTVVVTDKHTYRYPVNNTVLVAVGDRVTAGQALTDAAQLFELRDGEIPEDVRSLTVGSDLLAPGYVPGLQFVNDDVDVTVDADHASGRTYMSFALGGHPATVEQFWDDVHTRGIAQGTTLAELMDVRPSLPTQPNVATLPTTINPAQFLVQNLLRAHTCILLIRPTLLPHTGMNFSWLRHVRRALPPHVLLLTIFELQAQVSSGKLTVTDELTSPTVNQAFFEELTHRVSIFATTPKYINISCL